MNTLPWEVAGHGLGSRLFETALSSSVDPEQVFGSIRDGRIAPALGFAIWAETVALGSFAGVAMLALHVWDPGLTRRIAMDPFAALLLLLAMLLGVGVMVGLHALWGLCLDLSARVARPEGKNAVGFSRGLRFGLYACGWDLLTSPAGLGLGLVSRRARESWVPVYQAIRAPRVAMRAYLERSHGLDRRAQERVARVSVTVLGGTTLALSAGLGFMLFRFVWG